MKGLKFTLSDIAAHQRSDLLVQMKVKNVYALDTTQISIQIPPSENTFFGKDNQTEMFALGYKMNYLPLLVIHYKT